MPVSGLPPYDDSNIFARILRGEIPSKLVFEMSGRSGVPRHQSAGAVHVLIIPKGRIARSRISAPTATEAEIAGFVSARSAGSRSNWGWRRGYRLLADMGEHGGAGSAAFPCASVRWQAVGADGAAE